MVKQKELSPPIIFSALQKLFGLLGREEKIRWLGIAIFALLVSLLEVVTASLIVVFAQVLNDPSVAKKLFLKFADFGSLSPERSVFFVSISVGLVYLIKNIVAGIEVFFQNFSIQKMSYEFKKKLLNRYAQSDYGVYLTRNSSFGLHVVGGDAELAFSSGMISIASILSESVIFIFLTGMIVFMNPSVAFIIFATGVLIGLLILKTLLPRFYDWGKKLQQAGIQANQNLMQFFHGFKEIVLLGKRDAFVSAYHVHSKKRSEVQAVQTVTNALPRMALETLFVGFFVLTVSYLCMKHESPTQMIALLSGYLYAGFRLMPGLNRVINQLNLLKSVIPSIDRVYEEFTSVASTQYYVDEEKLTFNKSISFENVNFNYLNTNKKALSDINLIIKKGERIGVIGETGSGKSTLIDLLLGLLRPTEGQILIDNKYPVNAIQWHKKIGYVPQAVYLIDDSIEANIAFGEKDIDQDSLNRAIDAAQIRKFIDALTNGTKTIVGERGVRLSGGERQRIAIARALYHNPEVLIFDEATSALDNETEGRLIETINFVSKKRTVIMIAHRLTTLKDCDRIIQMNDGKLNLAENVLERVSCGVK